VRTQLVSIPTDTLPLDGAYYEPEQGAAAGAVLLFHGNTMNFYTGAPRFLPPALTRLGLACLAFNRRGHDILTTRASRTAEGGAYQFTHEAIADNNSAAAWLQIFIARYSHYAATRKSGRVTRSKNFNGFAPGRAPLRSSQIVIISTTDASSISPGLYPRGL